MRRKFIALLLVLVMCATTFAGCSSAKEETKPETKTETKEETKPEATKAEEKVEAEVHDPVTLNLWWPGSGDAYEELVQKLAELVHEKYDWITVEPLVIPWSDYDSKMNVAFVGGIGPDIFGVGMNTLPNYVQTGNMQDLRDLLGTDWDGWSDIPENIQSYGSYEGVFYGVMVCDVRPFMWRKDLFEKAGLDPETPPTSAEELYEYAKKLTEYDSEGKVKTAGFQIQTSGFTDQTLFAAMLMQGMDHFWNDNYELTLTDPKTIDAIKYCKRFVDDGLCSYSEGIVTTSFCDGTAAMTLNTACNELGNLKNSIGFDNVGVTVPFMMDGKNFCGGTIISVNNQSKNLEATMLAYEVITSTEGCEIAGLTAGFCPPRLSSLDAYVAQNPAIYQPVADTLLSAKTYGPLNPYFADFRNSILQYTEQIYYGKIGEEEGLQKATEMYIEAQKARDAN